MTLTLFSRSRDGRLAYYTLHDRQPSLDGSPVLTAAWRTEGRRERERRYAFGSEGERDRTLRRLFSRAIRRGYRLLYSFDRAGIGRFGVGSADPRCPDTAASFSPGITIPSTGPASAPSA